MKQEHKEGKSFYGNKLSFRGEKQDSAKKKKKICQPGVINGGWCMHRASLVHDSLLNAMCLNGNEHLAAGGLT